MIRLAVVCAVAAALAAGCGSTWVHVPNNNNHALGDAIERLHAVGLRQRFDAVAMPCGLDLTNLLVLVQSPRAPTEVEQGTVVTLRFHPSPIPSPAVPTQHERWVVVPQLVGLRYDDAMRRFPRSAWPCLHVPAVSGVDLGSEHAFGVVAQRPRAGVRLPAYGVMVGRGFKPTAVSLTLAVRSPASG